MNTYDLTQQEVEQVLVSLPTHIVDGFCKPVFIFDYQKAQRLLDDFVLRRDALPNLWPVQFNYMLAVSGLDIAMNSLLDALQSVDIEKYAMYKAFLNGARYYEFAKTYAMYEEIKVKLIEINSALDFSLEQLKAMWMTASQV
ncbi:MAG: hypothetical protein O2793_13710 [Proteobacteria bacterium]|nr:hypothetical protein [Pseudomonadota bacterium]MDA1254931.1 hypothetical protein [Pseudomonadota bacterium]